MVRFGLLGEDERELDFVLQLTTEKMLERRLQTKVCSAACSVSLVCVAVSGCGVVCVWRDPCLFFCVGVWNETLSLIVLPFGFW